MAQRYFSNQTEWLQRISSVLIIVIVAGIGTYLLLSTHAATPYASIEAESGAKSGVTTTADANASGGNYVQFGAGSTTTPPPSGGSPGSAPMGQTGTWNLLFDDEFNGTSLDLTKWIMCNPSFQRSCVPYNNEQELYNTTLPSNPNVYVSGGYLNLVTTKQNGQIYSGMVSTGPNVFGYNQPGYTGFQFTYGYYEARVKLPKGDGFWPSMWMLPNQNIYGPWPGSGEYDMFEVAGNNPSTVYMTEHDGVNGGSGDGATDQVSDTSANYHVFGFDWEPDHLAWYIDGVRARSEICTAAYANANPGVCDGTNVVSNDAIKNYPFYILANFSVGGSWGPLNGAPDGSTPFPATMSIDWIHVWQH
jgi:beta-glucanase (GH16 family)